MHKITDKDLELMTGVCSQCGPIDIKSVKTSYKDRSYYRCGQLLRETSRQKEMKRPRRNRNFRYKHRKVVEERLKNGVCEKCGFVAEDLCQLDVDHIIRRIDGGGDEPENLAILCANCHRLKSMLERQGALPLP